MKKIILPFLLSATILFTACEDKTKEVTEEVNTTGATEAIQKDTVTSFESAKMKISEAAKAVKTAAVEMAQEVKVEAETIAVEAEEKAKSLITVAETNVTVPAEIVEEAPVVKTEADAAINKEKTEVTAIPSLPAVPTVPEVTAIVPEVPTALHVQQK